MIIELNEIPHFKFGVCPKSATDQMMNGKTDRQRLENGLNVFIVAQTSITIKM